jgi:hypothetical protein
MDVDATDAMELRKKMDLNILAASSRNDNSSKRFGSTTDV